MQVGIAAVVFRTAGGWSRLQRGQIQFFHGDISINGFIAVEKIRVIIIIIM